LAGHDAGITGTFVDSTTKATLTVDLSVGKSITIGGNSYTIVSGATTSATDREASAKTAADSITMLQSNIKDGATVTLNGTTYTSTAVTENGTTTYTYSAGTGSTYTEEEMKAKITDGTSVKIGDDDADTYTARDYTDESNISADDAKELISAALKQANSIGLTNGSTASVDDGDGDDDAVKFTITKGTATVTKDLSFNLHVGADADMTNKIGVSISAMSTAGLGISGLNVSDDSGVAATYAIDAIADAISTVSAQRSALGAVQNRLEHTINNLDNVVENTTSAESRIRDTDMAEEMVEYSKNNILAQAGQSMLAQANQSNQGVLSLLG
jgi:flagellin